jgi:hypothetical protein
MFGTQICPAISGLRTEAKGKETAYIKRANYINNDLQHLKAGDDYWKKAIQSWSYGEESHNNDLLVHVGQETRRDSRPQ